MNLIWVTVHGFKRFEHAAKMNVDGKAIALVGPNEAGKSSFLKALHHLNSSAPFVRSGGSQELTRGAVIPDDQHVVEVKFFLDEADRRALDEVTGDAGEVRWVTIIKRASGGRFVVGLHPKPPERDLSLRRKVKGEISKLITLGKLPDQKENPSEPSLKESLAELLEGLDNEAQTLPNEVVQAIRNTATLLKNFENLTGASDVALQPSPEELEWLAYYEEKEHPAASARNILFGRRPQFLFFGEEERSLQPEYPLESLEGSPPTALKNLARLAGLDLTALRNAFADKDFGKVETLEEGANAQLKKTFSENWSQSGVSVRLRLDNAVLHVLVGEAHCGYVSIAERSDGLRQFVALLAFVSLEHSEQIPILLVDEAESHLHYDAQADLIQMFTKQKVVSKIIYTTHSIGCLPEDLGTGVRLIEPRSDG